jgi:hypothetical protein
MVKRHLLPLIAIFVGLAFASVIAFAAYDWFWRAPQARSTIPALRAELDQIPLPSDAHDLSHWSSYKGGHALVGVGFTSDLLWDAVEHHYDIQLQGLGWTPEATKSVKIWGRDLGGKIQDFRKGRLTASLYYRGGADRSTPPYTLHVSWGLR